MVQMNQISFDSVGNNMGKGENSVYQHFLPFPQCFPKALFWVSLKVGLCDNLVSH